MNNGIILLADKQHAISVVDGVPVQLTMKAENVLVPLNGEEVSVDYLWCEYGGLLCVYADTSSDAYGTLELSVIRNSGRYAVLTISRRFGGSYSYLLDPAAGELLDPLALLEAQIAEKISNVTFSPDGRYAFVGYEDSQKALLIDIASGTVMDIQLKKGTESIAGHFLDNCRILIIQNIRNPKGLGYDYFWTVYSFDTGESTDYTGLICPDGRSLNDGLVQIAGTLFYERDSDYLTLRDLDTLEAVVTEFKMKMGYRVFSCGDGQVGVIRDGVVFLVDMSGKAIPVYKVAY